MEINKELSKQLSGTIGEVGVERADARGGVEARGSDWARGESDFGVGVGKEHRKSSGSGKSIQSGGEPNINSFVCVLVCGVERWGVIHRQK